MVKRLRSLQLDISRARHTFRVVEIGPILTLARLPVLLEDEPFPLLRFAATLGSAGFNLFDRARWLREHGLLAGDARSAAVIAARLLCIAHVASALHLLRRAMATGEAGRVPARLRALIRDRIGWADETARASSLAAEQRVHKLNGVDDTNYRRCLRNALCRLLCAWQAGHVGRVPLLSRTHEGIVGLIGVVTSAADLAELWHAG